MNDTLMKEEVEAIRKRTEGLVPDHTSFWACHYERDVPRLLATLDTHDARLKEFALEVGRLRASRDDLIEKMANGAWELMSAHIDEAARRSAETMKEACLVLVRAAGQGPLTRAVTDTIAFAIKSLPLPMKAHPDTTSKSAK